jgi:hypothetical protein
LSLEVQPVHNQFTVARQVGPVVEEADLERWLSVEVTTLNRYAVTVLWGLAMD